MGGLGGWAGSELADSQGLEDLRPKFLGHIAGGNHCHLNPESLKSLAGGALAVWEIRVGQTFGGEWAENPRNIHGLAAGVGRSDDHALERMGNALREGAMNEDEISRIMVKHGRQQKRSDHIR